jgi:hypothetical protein
VATAAGTHLRVPVDELAAHVVGKPRDALVFTAPNGGPLRNTNFRPRALARAAESVRPSFGLIIDGTVSITGAWS